MVARLRMALYHPTVMQRNWRQSRTSSSNSRPGSPIYGLLILEEIIFIQVSELKKKINVEDQIRRRQEKRKLQSWNMRFQVSQSLQEDCQFYMFNLLLGFAFSFLTPGSLQLAGMHNIANVYTFSTILFMAVGIVQFLALFCSDTRRSKNFKKSHPTVSLSREQPHRRLSTQEHVVLSYLIDQLVCDV